VLYSKIRPLKSLECKNSINPHRSYQFNGGDEGERKERNEASGSPAPRPLSVDGTVYTTLGEKVWIVLANSEHITFDSIYRDSSVNVPCEQEMLLFYELARVHPMMFTPLCEAVTHLG